MRPKNNPVRVHKVCSMLQKALGNVFLIDTMLLFNKAVITVTAVYLGTDLSIAKVYLSFSVDGDRVAMLQKVVQHKNTIRRMLGIRIANKVRKVPQLRFYLDNSVNNATHVCQLMDTLEFPSEEVGSI